MVMGNINKTRGNKRGNQTDKRLLKFVTIHPGLSQYELAKQLKTSSGHIDGAVRRLLQQHKITLRALERTGRKVNLIYPKNKKSMNAIEVPSSLLKTQMPAGEQVFVYALDSSTIGISGKDEPDWREIAGFQDRIVLKTAAGKTIMPLPERFLRFYDLKRKNRVVSFNGGHILITVNGNLDRLVETALTETERVVKKLSKKYDKSKP
jgi:hypothetical protein